MTTAAHNQEQVPEWVKETVPDWLTPYRGSPGLTGPGSANRPKTLGKAVRGIDFWQVNHFIAYRRETADYLYGEYTPTTVEYRHGTLPALEPLISPIIERGLSQQETALAILQELIPKHVPHPSAPPCGPQVAKDRGLMDEQIVASGGAWCNEQARVFVRLCQIAGIPARLVFLFYDNGNGHAVSEFYTDGKWAFVDSTWICVVPAPDGSLYSTGECHDGSEARARAGESYCQRYRQLLEWTDDQLGEHNRQGIRQSVRDHLESNAAPGFGCFGVLNYPLPPR